MSALLSVALCVAGMLAPALPSAAQAPAVPGHDAEGAATALWYHVMFPTIASAHVAVNLTLRAAQGVANLRAGAAIVRAVTTRTQVAAGQMNVRTYVHARGAAQREQRGMQGIGALLQSVPAARYEEGLAQPLAEALVPRVVQVEPFGRIAGEMQEPLADLRAQLADYQHAANRAAAADQLYASQDTLRRKVAELEARGAGGNRISELKQTIAYMDAKIGPLVERTREQDAATVAEIEEAMADGGRFVGRAIAAVTAVQQGAAGKWAPYAPPPSLAVDARVAAAASPGGSAIASALREIEARRLFSERLTLALARVGVSRSDPLYNAVRDRVLTATEISILARMPDGELEGECRLALAEMEADRQTPNLYGKATLAGNIANLAPRYAPSFGFVKWNQFMWNRSKPDEGYSCDSFDPFPMVDNITISLVIDLDTGEILSGFWAGTAAIQDVTHGVGFANGSFSGTLSEGSAQAYGPGKAEGFAFGGHGPTRIAVTALGKCLGYKDGVWFEEPIAGENTVTLNVSIHGEWKASIAENGAVTGTGELMIEGTDEANNMGIRIVIADPPFVLTALTK